MTKPLFDGFHLAASDSGDQPPIHPDQHGLRFYHINISSVYGKTTMYPHKLAGVEEMDPMLNRPGGKYFLACIQVHP